MRFAPNIHSDAKADYPPLLFYKIHPDAYSPTWGTEDAACFDLAACILAGQGISVYGANSRRRLDLITAAKPILDIHPNERAMVPTGLIFDIPIGYDLKIYSRSGRSLKDGLTLANNVGVVDYGYVEESYILVRNDSTVKIEIVHGDRIAQGQMKIDHSYQLIQTNTRPSPKSDRCGGFGSTGW